jgi:hypothetical protein
MYLQASLLLRPAACARQECTGLGQVGNHVTMMEEESAVSLFFTAILRGHYYDLIAASFDGTCLYPCFAIVSLALKYSDLG